MPTTLSDDQVRQLQAELAAGRKAKQTEDIVLPLLNGQYGDEARALLKKAYPDMPMGEYDTKREVFARLDQEKAEREKRERDVEQSTADDRIAAERKATQEEFSYTDEGMKEVEKFMLDNHVANYEVAGEYLASKRPKASDGSSDVNRHRWNHGRSEEWKEISKDPEKWMEDNLMAAIQRDMDKASR